MRKALALALMVALVALGVPASADHSGDGKFHFQGLFDTNGDRKTDTEVLRVTYERHLHTHSLDAEAGWVDGDRKAYNCGYAFLRYRGFLVGRVTISKFKDPENPKNAYAGVSDKFMHEGMLNYDGTLPVEGNTTQDGEQAAVDKGKSCPGSAVEDYEPMSSSADLPVVTFQHGPHAIDVRDFADDADFDVRTRGLVFDLVTVTDEQVVVLAYQKNGDLPFLSIYYELVGDPQKGVAQGAIIPGTVHPVTMHVGCGLECGGHTHGTG